MTWTEPTRYVDGDFIRAPVWNTDVINNQLELHSALGFRASASAFYPQPRPAGEEQTVESDAGTATGGTWRLSYNGNFTNYIPFNATAAELANNLYLPGLYRTVGRNQSPQLSLTVTGTDLNGGFNIVFNSQYVPSPLEFVADDSLLVGDTITVTTITPSDSFALIPVQQAAVPPDHHSGQVSAGGPLPAGVWWFHGAVYWNALSTTPFPRAAIRIDNVAVAMTRAVRPAGSGQFGTADVFWTGEVAEDSVANLYAEVAASSVLQSPAYTWFEGWYRGESAS